MIFLNMPINKINVVQKEAMAEFMDQYKDLARNFRNNKQGKQRMNKLWEELAQKLNARRPPVKDAKLWKKVFRDQKYIIKNKLTCKKRSKGQTGSGVFVEIPLTFAEEQIIEAARLEASVIGVDDAQTSELDEKSYSTISSIGQTWDLADKTQDTTPDFENASISIRSPLQKKGEYQTSLKEAVKELVTIQRRSMQMKEEEFKANMEIKHLELAIKKKELEILNRK